MELYWLKESLAWYLAGVATCLFLAGAWTAFEPHARRYRMKRAAKKRSRASRAEARPPQTGHGRQEPHGARGKATGAGSLGTFADLLKGRKL